jgi:hypothetical protein
MMLPRKGNLLLTLGPPLLLFMLENAIAELEKSCFLFC